MQKKCKKYAHSWVYIGISYGRRSLSGIDFTMLVFKCDKCNHYKQQRIEGEFKWKNQ